MVLDQGYNRAEAAKSLGKDPLFGRWIREHQQQDGLAFRGDGKLTPEQEEIQRLKIEKEILNKAVVKTTVATIIFFTVYIILLIAINMSPLLYTKVYKLYTAYTIESHKPLRNLLEYIEKNNIDYVKHEHDNIVTLHGNTEGHSETIIIWHDNEKITGVRFDSF